VVKGRQIAIVGAVNLWPSVAVSGSRRKLVWARTQSRE
jgi:hypothetical protein